MTRDDAVMTRNTALITARLHEGLSQEALARRIQEAGHRLGHPNECGRAAVHRWEDGAQPQPHYVMLLETVLGQSAASLGFPYDRDQPTGDTGVDVVSLPARQGGLLETVPNAFTADTLAGVWVTCYQFSQPPKHHADLAHLAVTSERWVRIVNYPPEPRTEGHMSPFHNEIEAMLANRHLIGHWKNTNDTRYFGAIHLSVLPGETVMEGFFTNFISDVSVGTGFWRWVRLDQESLEGADLSVMTLRDPAEIYATVEAHTQYDAPLALTAVGEVA